MENKGMETKWSETKCGRSMMKSLSAVIKSEKTLLARSKGNIVVRGFVLPSFTNILTSSLRHRFFKVLSVWGFKGTLMIVF